MMMPDSQQQPTKPAFRSYEQVRDEISSRWSVADLTEQTDEDLERADEMFYKASGELQIVMDGERNGIKYWLIASGETSYLVRRFKNFVWCSCRDFFFRKKMCKHLALTAGVLCQKCRVMRAKAGKFCIECDYHTSGRFTG